MKGVYFILYLVLLTELLVVITERDELHEKELEVREKMLGSISESYKQPVILQIPNDDVEMKIEKNRDSAAIVGINIIGLVSEEERDTVEFFIDVAPETKNRPPGWVEEGTLTEHNGNEKYQIIKNDISGNIEFDAQMGQVGEYLFTVYARCERVLPGYLPHYLVEELEHMIGEHKEAVTDTSYFRISITKQSGVKQKQVEIVGPIR